MQNPGLMRARQPIGNANQQLCALPPGGLRVACPISQRATVDKFADKTLPSVELPILRALCSPTNRTFFGPIASTLTRFGTEGHAWRSMQLATNISLIKRVV